MAWCALHEPRTTRCCAPPAAGVTTEDVLLNPDNKITPDCYMVSCWCKAHKGSGDLLL